jgi:hypothetical protein
MNFSLIKKVILTVAVAALFIVPASIFALQSNNVKTADAAKPQHYSNPCNHICQGYYQASSNNQSKNHCPVMYYSYITNSYSSCTQVPQPKVNYSNSKNSTFCPVYCNTHSQTPQPITYPKPANNNTANYSNDYSYYNQNNSGNYVAQPSYQIPVPQPKQNYYDIFVEKSMGYYDTYVTNPKQKDYYDVFVPNQTTNTNSSYTEVATDTSSYDVFVPNNGSYNYTSNSNDSNYYDTYQASVTDSFYSN